MSFYVIYSFVAESISLYGHVPFYLYIHQLIDIWVVLFFAVINNVATNTHIQVFVRIYVFISLIFIARSGNC